MNLNWHHEASAEFVEAVAWYAQTDPELGERFILAVEGAVARLRDSPASFRRFDGVARRVLTEVFPYAVIYVVELSTLHILAVMHQHREPGYWKARL